MDSIKWKEKKELIDAIYRNTQQQTKVIQEKDEEKLLPLLNERQMFIEKLEKINKQIQELKNQNFITPEQIMLEEQIQQELQKVYDLEMNNQNQLKKNQEILYREIQDLQQSKKAMSEGYMKQQASTYGYFFDKKK